MRKDDGRPYCKECFNKKRDRKGKHLSMDQNGVTKCEQCLQPIVSLDRHVKLNGKLYHAKHFQCHTCMMELTNGCVNLDGNLYCQTDYEKMMMRVCKSCNSQISGRAIGALGGALYHPEHFMCSKCEKVLDGQPHFEHEGKILCQTHLISE